jgi:CubicO group peptidase (beta-lactamase class C family)
MKDTGFFIPPEKNPRLASAYHVDPATKAWIKSEGVVPGAAATPNTPPAFPSGAGGLLSTVDDYLQFARMMLGHGRKDDVRILSHMAVTLMTSNYLTPEQRQEIAPLWGGQGFGLGVAVVDNPARQDEGLVFSSAGSYTWPGYWGTWWQVDPKEDMIQIFMTQLPIDFLVPGGATRASFQRLSYEAIDD